MKKSPLSKGFIAIFLLIVILSGWIGAYFFIGNFIKVKILDAIHEKYEGYYKVDIQKVSLSIFNSTLSLEDISIQSDTAASAANIPASINGNISAIAIQWESMWDAVFKDEIHITLISVLHPHLYVVTNKNHVSQKKVDNKKSVSIDKIVISQPEFSNYSDLGSIGLIEYLPSENTCIIQGLKYEIEQNPTAPSHLYIHKIHISSFPDLNNVNEVSLSKSIFTIDSVDVFYTNQHQIKQSKAKELWPDSLPTPFYKLAIPNVGISNINIRIDSKNKNHSIHSDTLHINHNTIETKGLEVKFKDVDKKQWTCITIPNARIVGLNKDTLFLNEKIFIEEFGINGGKFIYTPHDHKSTGQYLAGEDTLDYPGLELPFELSIQKTKLENMHFIIPPSGRNFWLDVRNISVNADHVKFVNGKYPVFQNATISVGQSQTSISKGLYKMALDSISLDFTTQSASVKNLRVIPSYSKDEFGDKLGYQTDRIILKIPEIQLKGSNWIDFIDHGILKIDVLESSGYSLSLFRDRRIPFNHNRYVAMPQKLIQDIPFPLYINTIKLSNGRISYEEYSDKRKKSGTISFRNCDIEANQLNSRATSTPFTASFKANLMNRALFSIQLKMPLNDPSYRHQLSGKIGAMDIAVLNDFLEIVAGISIQKGFLDEAELSIDADSSDAEIEMTMLYHGLKININKKPDQDDEVKTNKFLTGLANMVLLKNNPMPFKPIRSINAEYERKTDKFVINYWWKTLLAGMIKSFLPDLQLKKEETTKKLKTREKKRLNRIEKRKLKRNKSDL